MIEKRLTITYLQALRHLPQCAVTVPFPAHIEQILVAYGVRADTKAALYDLYVSMGDEVLEVFADLAEGVTAASMLSTDDTLLIRDRVIERYLRRNHPQWLAGKPTPSLWHPREAEGRASGAALPLGEVETGLLMLGRNAHYGGRTNTISFDIVARDLEDAIAIGTAAGQQHTLPGSIGETSGTFDSAANIALIWEVQPNVYKPTAERNRAINKLYRRHRDWHRATLSAALDWLTQQQCEIFILQGSALAPTHEVNPEKPMSELIAALHDRTVHEVVEARGASLKDVTDMDELALLDSSVMNHALRKYVLKHGANGAISRIVADVQ
jgi:hypothetical protein